MSGILFYSNYCKHSQNFINILEQSGFSVYFNKISVDKNTYGKRTDSVKYYSIQEVPTIIVDDTKLVGKSAFKWLNKQIENSENSNNSDSPQKETGPVPQAALKNNYGKLYTEKDLSRSNDIVPGTQSLPSINVKKDGLKEKQINNKYNDMLKERNLS